MSSSELVTLTNDLIEAGKTANGGWTAAKLKLIGVDWPPNQCGPTSGQ